jgi:hypothetical protein
MKLLKAFGAFWFDFIVGDSWELGVGVLVALAAVGVIDALAPSAFAEPLLPVALPLMIVAVLGISLARAER